MSTSQSCVILNSNKTRKPDITIIQEYVLTERKHNNLIAGQVLDKNNGEPILGVSVLIESTKTGISTDINGNFKLILEQEIFEKAKVKFVTIGYLTIEVELSQILNKKIKVMMLDDTPKNC